jgi:hypothetical protein
MYGNGFEFMDNGNRFVRLGDEVDFLVRISGNRNPFGIVETGFVPSFLLVSGIVSFSAEKGCFGDRTIGGIFPTAVCADDFGSSVFVLNQ